MPFTARSLGLYLVVDPGTAHGSVIDITRDALRHGVIMLQLRWKSATDLEVVHLATQLQALASDHQVPFVINDRLDIALAVRADGVHLGVDDLPLEAARAIGGPQFVVGYSPESDDQARTARQRGADYLGIGPFAATSTKEDAGRTLGAAEFARRRALSPLPVVAIGGITTANVPQAIGAGADGVAVVSAIMRAQDPGAATAALVSAIRDQR